MAIDQYDPWVRRVNERFSEIERAYNTMARDIPQKIEGLKQEIARLKQTVETIDSRTRAPSTTMRESPIWDSINSIERRLRAIEKKEVS